MGRRLPAEGDADLGFLDQAGGLSLRAQGVEARLRIGEARRLAATDLREYGDPPYYGAVYAQVPLSNPTPAAITVSSRRKPATLVVTRDPVSGLVRYGLGLSVILDE